MLMLFLLSVGLVGGVFDITIYDQSELKGRYKKIGTSLLLARSRL